MKEFLENLSLKYKIIILVIMLIVIVVVFAILYKYYYAEDEEIYIENEITKEDMEEQDSSEYEEKQTNTLPNSRIGKEKIEKTIIVHVIGEVQTPGVVELEEGSRIIDAIEKAGGKTEEADLSKINLAYVIEDGVQIYVPRIGDDMEKIAQINEEAGEGIITQNSRQEDNKTIKVNINTASLEKLQTLPRNWSSNSTKNTRL